VKFVQFVAKINVEDLRSASQFSAPARVKIGDGLISHPVQFPASGVCLKLLIPYFRVKLLKPLPEAGQFVRGQSGDGTLKFLKPFHKSQDLPLRQNGIWEYLPARGAFWQVLSRTRRRLAM